jgi:chromosome segregation ATPase
MRIALIAVSFNLIAAVVIWLFGHRSGCFRERCRWAYDLAAANVRIKMLETEYAECATNANDTAEEYESLSAQNRTTIQDQRKEILQLQEEATRLKKEKDSIDIELLFYKTEWKAAGERILKLEAELKNSNEVSVILLKAETDRVKRLQSRIMSLTAKIGAMKRQYESRIRYMSERGAGDRK